MDETEARAAITITQPQTGDEAWTVTVAWPCGFANLADARIGLSRAGYAGAHTLTLENAKRLTRDLTHVYYAAKGEFEDRQNPYVGKALRLTVRDGVCVRDAQRWLVNAPDPDFPIGVNDAWRTGEWTETHAPYVKSTVEWLAENPGHPFDVFICDAADMPEWDSDAAAGEVGE